MRWVTALLVVSTAIGVSACGARSAPPSPAPVAASVKELPCREFIAPGPPERGERTVLGIVALPASPGIRRALQTGPSGHSDPAMRLFAKWGLTIRSGARFRLVVPARLRDRLSIGWGNAGEGHIGTVIAVDACRAPRGARWLSYAGGYYVRHPLCATLVVVAPRRRRSVRIGVGQACPGQRPPPSPTSR